MPLHLEELERRENPAPWIPGWDGKETVVYGNFDGDTSADDMAVVADAGGSCRVMAFNTVGDVILNTIVFDPAFRGGGRIAVVERSLDAAGGETDLILVVPGVGGGPHVAVFDLAASASWGFFAPYEQSFRGGLRVSSGDIDGDGEPEALFLPGDGGGPRLTAVDLRSYETEMSVWVGDPSDTSGDARFEATGGTIRRFGQLHFFIQYGEPLDGFVRSQLWPVPVS